MSKKEEVIAQKHRLPEYMQNGFNTCNVLVP